MTEKDILSNLVITKVHSVTTMYSEQNKKARRGDRPTWALAFKYEGETVYSSGDKHYLSNKNHIMLLPRGSSYEWQCNKAGHFAIIEFDCPFTHSALMSFPVKSPDKFLKEFQELEYKRTLKKTMIEPESIRDVYSILLNIVGAEPKKYMPDSKQQRLAPALEHIAKFYHTKLTNDSLAALTGLSTVYFRKLFTELTGRSPIDYVHALRIEKAKEMLRSDHGSVSDIAQTLGYPSIYDFSRAFKKHVGVAPSRY